MNYVIIRGRESYQRGGANQCTGKKQYRLKEAQQTANSLHRQGRFRHCRLYECPECGSWHIARTRKDNFK